MCHLVEGVNTKALQKKIWKWIQYKSSNRRLIVVIDVLA